MNEKEQKEWLAKILCIVEELKTIIVRAQEDALDELNELEEECNKLLKRL